MTHDHIQIDGAHGEGGGQIMRTAVALSLLTRLPFRMANIRARRPKPGLKAQHLHVLKAAMRLSGSSVTGAKEGSQVVTFAPGPPRGAEFEVDIGTAGSITLMMQTLLPALLFADGASAVTIRGGTDVKMSPTFDWFREVVLPHARPLADEVAVECERRGFYPKGGGQVRVRVRPKFGGDFDALKAAIRAALPPCALVEALSPFAHDLYSVASDALRGQRVVERQVDGARAVLHHREIRVHREYVPSHSIGTAVAAVARLPNGAVLGGDALGERGKPAEAVGREAAEALLAALDGGAPVDEHLADHLVPWLALRGGSFRAAALTDHLRTNCWLVEQFIGHVFRIDEQTKTVTAS